VNDGQYFNKRKYRTRVSAIYIYHAGIFHRIFIDSNTPGRKYPRDKMSWGQKVPGTKSPSSILLIYLLQLSKYLPRMLAFECITV
jgi:hypothetical protein